MTTTTIGIAGVLIAAVLSMPLLVEPPWTIDTQTFRHSGTVAQHLYEPAKAHCISPRVAGIQTHMASCSDLLFYVR